jgi:predicted enzyme related to lactoylglutathione lyase
MKSSSVSAVLFAKDATKVAAFYVEALGLSCTFSDSQHSALSCGGFELIIQQIPKHIADGFTLQEPPRRRIEGAIRLNLPVQSIEDTRKLAGAFGGEVDAARPAWAPSGANMFLGQDPEGNVFMVSASHAC